MLVATVLALGSAGLHATWNLVVKTSAERDLATWGVFLTAGIVMLPVTLVIGGPGWSAAPFLAASALIHIVYVIGLANAYDHGDFSLVYPVARGGGALLAAFGGVLVLGDVVGGWQWAGILLVAVGLISLAGRGADRVSLTWALLTAASIGAYTVADSHGSRQAVDGVRYGIALMPGIAVTVSATQIARGRSQAFVSVLRRDWLRLTGGGLLVTIAYTMVMVAVRRPGVAVGYVTMLRESSVVIAALLGWLFLHERMGRHRLISSVVIVAGLVTLIAFRPS